MADPEDSLPLDFYRGYSFLGRPVSVSLGGQEPGGPASGGPSASLSAGGAPVAPTSPVSGGVIGVGATGLTPLQEATAALGITEKGVNVGQQLLAEPSATRGDTGGTSLSDTVRSASDLPGTIQTPQGILPTDVSGDVPALGGGSASEAGTAAGGLAGDVSLGGGVAGLLGAGLSLAGGETGNKDLALAGNALGQAGGAVGTGAAVTAADAAAASGAELGLGATVGAAAAPFAASLLAAALLSELTGGEVGNISDFFTGGGTDVRGRSKALSRQRTGAAQDFDLSALQNQTALQQAQQAQAQGVTDPGQLTTIGQSLLDAATSYYAVRPSNLEGASSYITGSNRPDAMAPFNQAMQLALSINAELKRQGLPGLQIPIDLANAAGLTQPVNQSSYASQGADFVPQWGPSGPPPADLTSPEGQAWLNQAFTGYEAAGGQPTPPWLTSPPPATPGASDAAALVGATPELGGVGPTGGTVFPLGSV